MVRGLENTEQSINVTIDENGFANKKEFYHLTVQKFKNSILDGFIPKDSKKYEIDGSPESWAEFALRIVCVESDFNVNCTNPDDPGGSYGLFQWGFHYGITKDNWKDPNAQLDAFINYAKQWVIDGGEYINPPRNVDTKKSGKYGGFAAVFSTIRNDKVNDKSTFRIIDRITEDED